MEHTTLPVKGMHCASCASTIQRKLEKLDGVESCTVNYGTEKASIEFDPQKVTIPEMNEEIDKLGYSLVNDEMKMDHSVHAGHDMMAPISADTSVK